MIKFAPGNFTGPSWNTKITTKECRVVKRMARVFEAFVFTCEKVNRVKTRTMLHGKKGLCPADVRKPIGIVTRKKS
jgi:hypothetical protein